MNSSISNQRNYFPSAAITAFFLSLVLILPFFFRLPADPDFCWHLKSGIIHWEGGKLPQRDIFSYTFPGASWINHEWLTDWIFGGIFLYFGEPGLFLLRNLLLILFVLVLSALYRHNELPFVLIPPFVWLTLTYAARYLILRPHFFTYLFSLLLILIFEKAEQKPRLLYFLIPLMLLWVNLHGGFILGMGLASIYLLDFYREKKLSKKQFIFWLTAFFLSTFLNPYGIKLHQYLVRELLDDHSMLSEWQPFFAQRNWPLALFHYSIFILLPLFACSISRKPTPHPIGFLWIAAAVLTILHRRFFILLNIFAVLFTATHFGYFWKEKIKTKTFSRICKILTAFLMVSSVLSGIREYSISKFHIRQDPVLYPKQAIKFLKTAKLGKKLCLPIHWGGYAIFELWPQYLVSIDGRYITVYPKQFTLDHLKAWKNGDLLSFIGSPKPDVLLIENRGKLRIAVHENSDWQLIYQDRIASIFIPKQGASQ